MNRKKATLIPVSPPRLEPCPPSLPAITPAPAPALLSSETSHNPIVALIDTSEKIAIFPEGAADNQHRPPPPSPFLEPEKIQAMVQPKIASTKEDPKPMEVIEEKEESNKENIEKNIPKIEVSPVARDLGTFEEFVDVLANVSEEELELMDSEEELISSDEELMQLSPELPEVITPVLEKIEMMPRPRRNENQKKKIEIQPLLPSRSRRTTKKILYTEPSLRNKMRRKD